MENRWSDSEALRLTKEYARHGISEEITLRVYTTRLLGQNHELVLHGGGNTSVKTKIHDIPGDSIDVLCVKGSGWDMARIEPEGLPAVRLAPLLKLRTLNHLSDDDMVSFKRSNLVNSNSPNPSVEALLHAFLPHTYVDHTHANAILSITNQPDGDRICEEIFGDRLGIIPYIKPGFQIAKKGIEVAESRPDAEGLIALKHGIFTFGETAELAYHRMIEFVSLAETYIRKGRNSVFAQTSVPKELISVAEIAPAIRGACTIRTKSSYKNKPFVLDFRATQLILSYVNGKDLHRYSQIGVATPDHVIRTKNLPLILPIPKQASKESYFGSITTLVNTYIGQYHRYFERHNVRHSGAKVELDPVPRVVLVPGVGLFGIGRTYKDAVIAADIAESTVKTITDAESIGTYESISESEMFDLEYWSLEQAKLAGQVDKALSGNVVVITGGGGTIGTAIARAFSTEGAEIVVLDIKESKAREVAKIIGGSTLALGCDVTNSSSVRSAFDKICTSFGGIDILVSNAGAAWQGKIGTVSDDVLRQSFELNFFAHQTVAQNAVRVMKLQDSGGVLLFNVSKQAINPGLDFGPYGLPKAATMFLVRQYALDHGADGIRANAINADRIRSGLLTSEMIAARAAARGTSAEEYMSGNLLGQEVTADDVAQAFVHQALEMKTTANVTTVDGGNISSILR
jgi:rhamnose utilization protein RhaD (predicted bifunctional aldolase and dehydrogenase)/NAD(P)-dependent dehydrogenase (short-subunit alcohol dehydrogenase family)